MEHWKHINSFLAVILLFGITITLTAQDFLPIKLPEPQTDGGRPLMEVLKDRKSVRSFKSDTLSLQVLSDLCWAAFGINRPESGRRTAPSARNRQEIDVYVALQKGLFLYDALTHQLNPITNQDLRGYTGRQPFVGGSYRSTLSLLQIWKKWVRVRRRLKFPGPMRIPDSSVRMYIYSVRPKVSALW